jgi:hypothetical protein
MVLGWALTAAIVTAAERPAFDRREWGTWEDADSDCQDTRTEVLIRDALAVYFQIPSAGADCEVAAGQWRDPYTAEEVKDPSRLHIDHVVSLAEAHRSGGHAWSAERKAAYFNDLGYRWHLLATTATVNQRKGARGPQDWRPPAAAAWCGYGQAWATTKFLWNLSSTAEERLAVRELVATCR